ncbi:MAG TPA: DUF6624 domain-containing protein [Parapedobacter sp.]|nr:DUF6624 domain-containing protein [Parapedobacter sp.]
MISTTFAQDMSQYGALTKQAKQLYENKEYDKAGQKYSDAFVANGNKGIIGDRYMAASAWAMAGQPDSAFVNLFKIVDSGYYTDKSEVVSDSTFTPLHTDNRWDELIEKLNLAEAKLDRPLIAMLDTIFREDQLYRFQSDSIEKQYGRNSEELKAHWDMIAEKDSINLVKVKRVLDERGWLGRDVVGPQGNQTLFLVIQHADLATQQKYIPMMREAAKKGNANGAELAMLEDRVALRTGKRQIYGSQLWRDSETGEFHVMPLEDPDNVDERRSSVGLGKLADYISIWDLK